MKPNLEIARKIILIVPIYVLILLIGFFLYPIVGNYALISEDTVDVGDYVIHLFPEIPEVYLEGITNIYLQNNRTSYHKISFEGNSGYHNPYSREIFIFTDEVFYVRGTLLHEIGHDVYYYKLNQTQRDEWEKIHKEAWNLPQERYCFISWSNGTCKDYMYNERFITKYAETNPREDFAESFLDFMNYKEYIYMECYLKECRFGGFKYLTEARWRFMIENIYKIYEPEDFESNKESIMWED